MRKVLGSGSWSIPSFASGGKTKEHSPTPSTTSVPATPSAEPASTDSPFTFPTLPHHQIHIFRINDTSTSRYAICPTYCLPRLRAVCEFWTYVRAIERGLLLEEGFHFVGGKGVNGALVESRSGSTVSLHGKSRSSLAGLKSVESLATQSNSALAGLAPLDRQGGEMPVAVVFDDETLGDKTDDTSGEPAKSTEAVTVLEPVTVVEPEATESTPGAETSDEADASKDEDDLKVPSSPMMSAPSSPVLGQGSSSTTSLNKPPVPKRDARRPATPTPVAPAESESGSPAPGAAAAEPTPTPPKLPPRSVSTPVSGPKGGNPKAAEIVDAMDIVGGATGWEDRCWTEVVRLKESMFWTRMAREPEAL